MHKHIESSHLTPEWEAALVLPRGNTWTCEASHEFSNVDGPHNLEFWLEARKRGSPLKIFPLPGSAVPPTAYEWGGGYFGHDEQREFMAESLMVAGLDEVMDWPAVWNPENPSYERLWGMIEATFAARGVVEGHGSGLRDLASINAFAAAGLASDHEVQTPEETWDKLMRGLFVELRIYAMPEIVKFLIGKGLADWSQIAFTTDDRSASHTLELGASDHNARLAIESGLVARDRHPMRRRSIRRGTCGSRPMSAALSPGRFADVVLLSDLASLKIEKVWADGAQVSEGKRYTGEVPRIDWPAWATNTINIRRKVTAQDFALRRGAGTRDHEGRGHPPVPLASRLLHARPAGARRRGRARSFREHHQIRDRRPLLGRGARSRRCSGAAADRARRRRRSPARSRMTSTTSGSSARPTPRWRKR